MEARRGLTWSVVSLIAVGAIAAALPFLGSLKLNPRSGETLPRFDISDLSPGSARVFRLAGSRGSGFAIVVTRDKSGALHAFELFMSDGRIGVPGESLFVNYWCDDFGAVSANDQPDVVHLGCNDDWLQQPEFSQTKLDSRWSLAGEGLGHWNADLQPIRHVVEHNEIVIGKRP